MRIAAAAFWVLAGTMHFLIPRQYEAIVAPYLARSLLTWRGTR